MPVVFAPERLFDNVLARFAAEGAAVAMFFGWSEPARHKVDASRIVFVPGDAGKAGDVVAPRQPESGDVRFLAELGELVTVHVSGFDPTAPESQRAQYNATRLLFDAFFRAVYLAAHGTFRIVSLVWNVTKVERPHGVELVCVLAVEAPIPDTPFTFAPVDTGAAIDTSVHDVTETTVAAPEIP